MKCERAIELLTGPSDSGIAAERREAAAHAEGCDDCRDASMAVHALRLASMAKPPAPRSDALSRAMRLEQPRSFDRAAGRGRFWGGMAVGAALAASLAVAVLWFGAGEPGIDPIGTPRLQMALYETRDVKMSLATDAALEDAEIRVRLGGGIGLVGYPGTSELQWRTDLDAGANQLTLPIIATGEQPGQVIVEVLHGGKRRTFLVDVEIEAPV
jgi:hypothetical protein